ncbi:hypothetical protein ScPMuIL_010239 [Solemya velum]
MATVDERRIACVVGALTADAAAQPLHWVYNLQKLDDLTSEKDDIGFMEPSANPFYRIETGMNSCYSDQLFTVLKSLNEWNGVRIPKMKEDFYRDFGPESVYEASVDNSDYEPKVKKEKYPINGHWRNQSIREFIANYGQETEKSDHQADAFVRPIPVVAMYAGTPDMLDRVKEVIALTQDNNIAISVGLASARLLEQYIINGKKTEDAVEKVIAELRSSKRKNPNSQDETTAEKLDEVLSHKNKSHREATAIFRNNCGLPGSFQSAVHAIVTTSDFATGVEMTIKSGGCNCSRSGLIGACLAAQTGLEGIPERWQQKTKRFSQAVELATKMISLPLE